MITRRRIFWALILLLILHLSGFFSPPTLEYWLYVGLPKGKKEMRNINLYLPFPYYRGIPLPHYQGKPIREISDSFQVGAGEKKASLYLTKTKQGKMLKVFIPKLSDRDKELGTDCLELKFPPTFKLSFLFTPLYFLKDPGQIFWLNPKEEKWRWQKQGKGTFRAKKDSNTLIFAQFGGESILVGVRLRVRRRVLLGHIFVQETLGESSREKIIKIKKKGWQRIPLQTEERRSLWGQAEK